MLVLEATAWRGRAAGFGELAAFDDGRPIVVMPYAAGAGEVWSTLRELWLDLPPHHHVLDAIEGDGDELLLRYAAIAWQDRTELEPREVATWGRQLIDAYIAIAAHHPAQLGHFARPVLLRDVARNLRLGFLPVEAYTPLSPAALPTLIVTELLRLRPDAVLHEDLLHAATLAELRDALDRRAYPPLDEATQAAIVATEEGLGWLHLDEPVVAAPLFRAALRLDPGSHAAKEGRARCDALRGLGERPPAPPRPEPPPMGLHEALRVLEQHPRDPRALSEGARAALAWKRPALALELAERRLAIDEEDLGIHFVRGRALLITKRFVEARAAFGRACELEPTRIEAMVLRREADRSARRVAKMVGVPRPLTLELPAHLAALREPLAAGRVDEVLPQLAALPGDPVAQHLRAECLAFAGCHGEALEAFDRALALAPDRPATRLGHAYLLRELGRLAEAWAALAGLEGREAARLREEVRPSRSTRETGEPGREL